MAGLRGRKRVAGHPSGDSSCDSYDPSHVPNDDAGSSQFTATAPPSLPAVAASAVLDAHRIPALNAERTSRRGADETLDRELARVVQRIEDRKRRQGGQSEFLLLLSIASVTTVSRRLRSMRRVETPDQSIDLIRIRCRSCSRLTMPICERYAPEISFGCKAYSKDVLRSTNTSSRTGAASLKRRTFMDAPKRCNTTALQTQCRTTHECKLRRCTIKKLPREQNEALRQRFGGMSV